MANLWGATVVSITTGGQRVIRGGSWNYEPESVRVSSRTRNPTAYRSFHIGVRLAQDPEP